MKSKNSKKKNTNDFDSKEAARALEVLFAAGYVDKKKLYLANFMRGIFFSLGSIVGATVIIALLLWVLSAFDTIPVIGNFVQAVQNSIDAR